MHAVDVTEVVSGGSPGTASPNLGRLRFEHPLIVLWSVAAAQPTVSASRVLINGAVNVVSP